jgi:hypothetical protein
MSNETVNRSVNIYINSGEAAKAYDTLIAKEKKLNEELAKTADPKRIKALQTELGKLSEPIDRANKKLKGEMQPSIKEMTALVAKLGSQLRHMSSSDADFSNVLKQYAQAKNSLAQIQVEVKKVENAHKEVSKNGLFGDATKFGAAAGAAAAVAIEAFSKVSDFIKGSFEEAMNADRVGARLQNTLENVGHSDAFDRIMSKADALAKKFKYLDNDEIVGVFNKLIDYGKLTETQMNDLTPVIIDFAAKQRISLEESSSVIIKSLEGNSKGLKEYGINMKDAANPTEALAMIMGTLKEKVNGAGEAFMNTAEGGVATTQQQVKDLQEEIGTGLLPVLKSVLSFLNTAIQGMAATFAKAKNFIKDIRDGVSLGTSSEADKEKDYVDYGKNKGRDEAVAQYGKMTAAQLKAQEDLVLDLREQSIQRMNKIVATGTKDQVLAAKQELANFEGELEGIKVLMEKGPFNKNAADDDAERERKKLAAERAKQLSEDQKKQAAADEKQRKDDLIHLYKELKKISLDQDINGESEKSKELNRAAEKYDELRKLAHGNAEALKNIDEAYLVDVVQIEIKYGRKLVDEKEKTNAALLQADRERIDKQKELLNKLAPGGVSSVTGAHNTDVKAGFDLRRMKGDDKERLRLDREMLDREMQQAIGVAGLTENQIALIKEEYRQKDIDLEKNYLVKKFNEAMAAAQAGIALLSAIDDAKKAKEDAELARDRKVNDQKKKNLDRQLKDKLISQKQHDREVEKLDKAQEKREHQIAVKQFKRNQRMQEIQAAMNGAQAVTSILAQYPKFDGGIAMAIAIGLAIATTAAQVATIASAKPPEYAKGGRLSGPSHADNNGMPVTDPRTGSVQAYLEGDEGIVNKRSMRDRGRYNVSGTPSQIISKLNAMHGGVNWEGGATLQPVWRNSPASRMNFAAINTRMSQRMFADGGVFNASAGSAAENSNEILFALQTQNQIIQQLSSVLSGGIVAVASIRDINDKQARLAAIKDDATMK